MGRMNIEVDWGGWRREKIIQIAERCAESESIPEMGDWVWVLFRRCSVEEEVEVWDLEQTGAKLGALLVQRGGAGCGFVEEAI
jgi:hypothetical protein